MLPFIVYNDGCLLWIMALCSMILSGVFQCKHESCYCFFLLVGEPSEWISADWLSHWMSEDDINPIDPIDNQKLLCTHNK